MNPMVLMGLASLAMSAYSALKGDNDKGMTKVPTLSPDQKKILAQNIANAQKLGGQGGGYQNAIGLLQDYLNPQSDVYGNFERPYLTQFEQQTVPMLAERFAGMGGGMGGGLSSSGFGQALSSAGGNLQTQLAAMKSGLQKSAITDLMQQYLQLSQTGLNAQPFGYQYQQQGPGFGASAFSNSMPYLMPYMLQNAGTMNTNTGMQGMTNNQNAVLAASYGVK